MKLSEYKPDDRPWDVIFAKWDAEQRKNMFTYWINNTLFPHGMDSRKATYMLLHPWEIIDWWFREIKWAWQRVFRGWDDRVVWSIDGYLARMIPQWVRSLKEDGIGFPADLYTEEEWETATTGALLPEEREKILVARWEEILETIAVGFEEYMNDEKYDFNEIWYPGQEERLARFNLAFDLFRKYFPNLWD